MGHSLVGYTLLDFIFGSKGNNVVYLVVRVDNEFAHNINLGITHVWRVSRKGLGPEGIRQIFVGNLNPDTITEGHLRNKFKRHGEILSIKLINRKHYNQGK